MTEHGYVELHCHSVFSLLDGASSPEALVRQAAALGMPALALTDHDSLAGAVRFVTAAREAGIHPILGAELTLHDESHLTLLVENDQGWRNLCTLISLAQHHAPKGSARLPPDALHDHAGGLVALSGCAQGAVATAVRTGDRAAAMDAAQNLITIFDRDHCFIELQHHLQPGDTAHLADLAALAAHLDLPIVATNNVHYATRRDRALHDVLTCIRHHTTLDQAGSLLHANSERYLKSGGKLAPLFAAHPHALWATTEIAERCGFELQFGIQDLPRFPTPPGMDAPAYLHDLCLHALPLRYGDQAPQARQQLDHELRVITHTSLANYFLIVHDIVRFARDRGIRCQGRGSAANSLVAYLLGISPIDPLAHDLVFERFLAEGQVVLPDIDIDFAADRREEVIQYVYRRYGTNHAAMACTLVTFRSRSAARDIGKVLGLPSDLVAQAVASAAPMEGLPTVEDTPDHNGDAALAAQLQQLCQDIHGLPRHVGIHNGGMVLTGTPIAQRLPTEPATMPGRVVVQWDKDALETAGMVKIDILGLRMLGALAEAEAIVRAEADPCFELDRLSFDDPEVYAMIARGDTIGMFQVESRAQAQIQPRLQPRCFNDLVIGISLIRPGPLQGEMVHPYLRRRAGIEPVTYAHPLLRPALQETLGVILFQEQVLKVARDVAGFQPAQGEQLRRALGGKLDGAALHALRDQFLEDATVRDVPADVAETIFGQLLAFAGYAFPKSHAAAFAVLVYQSAYLKRYHPAAFFAALLNHQPMGFWPPAQLVADAKRHGVRVLPVHLERSADRCRVRGNAIRLGLRSITGLGPDGVERIVAARRSRPFGDLTDLCRRTRLPRGLIEQLIMVGALDHWQVPRRTLLWRLGGVQYREDALPLPPTLDDVALPDLHRWERLRWEEQIQGVALDDHPLAALRPALAEQGVLSSRDLHAAPHASEVCVAGRLVIHQAPPTAKGHHFLTLEDEHDLINVILRPDVVQATLTLLHHGAVLLVTGIAQQSTGVTNVIANTLQRIITD